MKVGTLESGNDVFRCSAGCGTLRYTDGYCTKCVPFKLIAEVGLPTDAQLAVCPLWSVHTPFGYSNLTFNSLGQVKLGEHGSFEDPRERKWDSAEYGIRPRHITWEQLDNRVKQAAGSSLRYTIICDGEPDRVYLGCTTFSSSNNEQIGIGTLLVVAVSDGEPELWFAEDETGASEIIRFYQDSMERVELFITSHVVGKLHAVSR